MLHGRLEATEETLTAVGERQKELRVEQETMRDELKTELLQKLKLSLQEETASRSTTLRQLQHHSYLH